MSSVQHVLDNGGAVWLAALAPLFALDAWLVAHQHRSLSAHAGNHPALTLGLLLYLGAHLIHPRALSFLRPFDPLAAAGRRLEPKGNLK